MEEPLCRSLLPQAGAQDLRPAKRPKGAKSKQAHGCYHCGSASHRARNCPEATCRLCGVVGHDVGACPQKPQSPVDLGQFASAVEAPQEHGCAGEDGGRARSFSYVELFCGMGGFRVALDRLGGRCVFASEVDRFCVKNYQDNFGDRPAGDICRVPTEDVPHHDFLVGGFPCQPFSSSGSRLGLEDPSRGVLFREIARVLRGRQPRAFLLENVRGLYLHDDGNTLKLVQKELEECGYTVTWELLDAVRLLPQERCRLFLAGVRRDIVQEKEQRRGSAAEPCQPCQFQFPAIPDLERGVEDILHRPAGSGGGNDELSASELEKLALTPHQLDKVTSQNYTKEHPEARFLSDPTKPAKTLQSSYAKYMVGSQFLPAVPGEGSGDGAGAGAGDDAARVWRRFSAREAARLQGFPESFVLCPHRAYHMAGNAVAPPLVAMVAASLLQHVGVAGAGAGGPGWGWAVARGLLLDSSPGDSRRTALERKLALVGASEP